MRVEYINPFVEAAFTVLKEVLNVEVKRGEIYLKSTSMPVMGVAAIVGLAGDVEGRVLFDMSKQTALQVASAMNGEQLASLDDLTPPAIFTGENMEVSDQDVEALIVPMELPLGKIEINVAIRERM
jgi:chemotaxis protein CheX